MLSQPVQTPLTLSREWGFFVVPRMIYHPSKCTQKNMRTLHIKKGWINVFRYVIMWENTLN